MSFSPSIEPSGVASPWERYRRALSGERLPAALVDLDAFDANVDQVVTRVRQAGKRLRVASKSIRCLALLERALTRAGETASGVMTYSAAETSFLAEKGLRDLLLAYPTVRDADLALLAQANRLGARAAVIVDSAAHLEALERAAVAAGFPLPFVVELDVGYRVLGLHIGAARSPLASPAGVVDLVRRAKAFPHLRFAGVMAYESQIAGVTDASPFSRWSNAPKRVMKLRSRRAVEAARRDVVQALSAIGSAPALVNGGGTGSLAWASREGPLTEVTVGSAFMASHLFDYYRDVSVTPALYFGLQVARQPAPGIVTCHGGGYVASGEAGPDRLPLPALPAGLSLLPLEGAGEVQTPLRVPAGVQLALGDPVFFRPAKAGELAEHVNEYLLIRGDRIVERVPTYRGLGQAFLG